MAWPFWLANLLWATQAVTISGSLAVSGPAVWVDGGRQVAFVAPIEGEPTWHLAPRDGKTPPAELKIEPRPESASLLWWHPDGRRMAYVSRSLGQRTMFVGAMDGAESVPFAVVGSISPLVAAWSPDGGMLAFGLRPQPGSEKPYDLFACQDNGGGGTRVPLEAPPTTIVWAKGGKQFAYTSRTLGRNMLFVCDLDQHIARGVSTHLTVEPGTVAWSPDGRLLTFNGALDPAAGLRLFVTRPAGQRYAERVERPGYLSTAPACFSPDGHWLAWTAGPRGAPSPAPLVLGERSVLAEARRISPGNAAEPAFSPISDWLVFASIESDSPRRSRLLALRTEQPASVVVVDEGPCAGSPVFSPDGSRLAYLSGEPDKQEVRVLAWPPD